MPLVAEMWKNRVQAECGEVSRGQFTQDAEFYFRYNRKVRC